MIAIYLTILGIGYLIGTWLERIIKAKEIKAMKESVEEMNSLSDQREVFYHSVLESCGISISKERTNLDFEEDFQESMV